jgi:eukaryotic-like serine/threonine-protein kinase
MPSDAKPAEVLSGLTLESGWIVAEAIPRPLDATGGTFSTSYRVERADGDISETAFLKALDFTMITQLGMPIADALKLVTDAYVFERDLVLACSGQRMSNVVRALDAGEVEVEADAVAIQFSFLRSVPYIVFEIADGDVRRILSRPGHALDEAWAFRILHGVANGLRQLHQVGIAHQDLKPSNVMTFGPKAKVGDLGRASSESGGLFDNQPIAGDLTYASPELLYGELHSDDKVRRRAVDTYHLASMGTFLVAGIGLTPLIEAELEPAFHWRSWPRDYRNALPYVREAFDRALLLVADQIGTASWAPDFIQTIRELGDPDPLVRGNPSAGDGPLRYSMERYVSIFNRLAYKAEIEIRKGLA